MGGGGVSETPGCECESCVSRGKTAEAERQSKREVNQRISGLILIHLDELAAHPDPEESARRRAAADEKASEFAYRAGWSS